MTLPTKSDMALKEWAVAVRVMGRGGQVLTLRKGGIHRDDKEFRVVHDEFLLYPTYEHQRPELLRDEYRADLARTLEEGDAPGLVQMAYWCRVTDKFELRDPGLLERLSPFHIWSARLRRKAPPLEAQAATDDCRPAAVQASTAQGRSGPRGVRGLQVVGAAGPGRPARSPRSRPDGRPVRTEDPHGPPRAGRRAFDRLRKDA